MNSVVIFYLIYTFIVEKSVFGLIQMSYREKNTILSRQTRTTPYTPYQSGISIGAAVAVPVDNGRFDVFLSYCIAGGFGQPEYDSPEGINPPPFQTISEDSADQSRKRKTRHTVLTRRKFYRIFADNLKQHGFNVRHCALKAICEAAQYQFGEINGVLGDIIHILFTPSTSRNENLPKRYYEAERNGHLNLCHEKYQNCPVSLFDFISFIK